MGRSEKNLKAIFERSETQELEVKSGEALGLKIRGFFSFNYESMKLDGRPLATSGPIFSCLHSDGIKIKPGDKAEVLEKSYVVKDIKVDPSGSARIEFERKVETLSESKDKPGELY